MQGGPPKAQGYGLVLRSKPVVQINKTIGVGLRMKPSQNVDVYIIHSPIEASIFLVKATHNGKV